MKDYKVGDMLIDKDVMVTGGSGGGTLQGSPLGGPIITVKEVTFEEYQRAQDDGFILTEAKMGETHELFNESKIIDRVNPIHNPDVPEDLDRAWKITKNFVRGN